MQQKRIEIYRVEREQRKLPVIYDKVSFGLSREELAGFPAAFPYAGKAALCSEMVCEAICRIRYDISGME